MLSLPGITRSLRTRPELLVAQLPDSAIAPEAGDIARRVRKNSLIPVAIALIAGQLAWKAYLLSHFYFRQDDFWLLDGELSHGLSLKYLFTIIGGHLRPGGLAIYWLVTRLSPYDWLLASIVTIAGLAAASFVLLLLLLNLFGRRPAILIPLIVFLFTPLTLPGLSFWTTVIDWLPLQLTVLSAIYCHVRYVRSDRIGYAVAAAAWLGAGMLFDEQGVLVSLFIFALTSAYLVTGRWPTAAMRALRSFRRAWTIYAAVTVGYLTLFLIQLQTSAQQPTSPGHISSVLKLAAAMLRAGFVPAALGGQWRWFAPDGDYGFAAETAGLTQVTWVLAALIIAASLWYRRRAARSWLILAGWLLLADFGPVAISRLTEIPATLLGEDLHYLADAAPILAICIGLAFWPVIGEEDPYRIVRPGPVALPVSAFVLTGAFLMGSMWSGVTYLNETSSAKTRSYIATAQSALARAKPGTVIVSEVVPRYVMFAGFLGSAAQTSQVLAPLAPNASRIRFTAAPDGAIRNLVIFDNRGLLRPALDVGVTSVSRAGNSQCWPLQRQATRIPLTASVSRRRWILQLRYSGPATTIQLRLGTGLRTTRTPTGKLDLYVSVVGDGSSVVVRRLSGGPPACISGLTVGHVRAAGRTAPPRAERGFAANAAR